MNDWKSQIHWNKIDWVNTRSRDEQKIHFCVSFKNNCFKDNIKPAHWVGHPQLRSLDTYEFFKITPGVDEKKE